MNHNNNPDAEAFAKWLLEIGQGRNSDENDEVEIPTDMQSPNIKCLMTFVYSNFDFCPSPSPDYFLQQMIIAARNSDVNDMNETLLEKMPGTTEIRHSADQIIHESGADPDDHRSSFVPPEFLHSITSPSLPPGELKIKIGCLLILLQNLSPKVAWLSSDYLNGYYRFA